MKATHEVSVHYFPSVEEAELTWKRLEDGEEVSVTVPFPEGKGAQLVEVIEPCVYHPAVVGTAVSSERVDEFCETWINGNRKWVMGELNALSPASAMLVVGQLHVRLPMPEIISFMRMLTQNVSQLYMREG